MDKTQQQMFKHILNNTSIKVLRKINIDVYNEIVKEINNQVRNLVWIEPLLEEAYDSATNIQVEP